MKIGRFWAALRFLTILPLPAVCRQTEEDLVRSVPFFPLIGLLIGLFVAGCSLLFGALFPPGVAAVLSVALLAVAHGGLHLDGLADTGDGFFSHSKRERVMEIMRDSRIGAFGCLALAGVLALKVAAVASLSGPHLVRALLLAPLAGRCVMVPMLVFLPSARPDGLGYLFSRGRSAWEAIWAVVLLGVCAWLTAGVAGLIAAGAMSLGSVAFAALCSRKIGGFTGDTLGAASELAEMVMLVALSALSYRGVWVLWVWC